MTNLNYGVSVTNVGELPQYKADWKINSAQFMATGGNDAAAFNSINALSLKPILDIEMQVWAGGQITEPISDFASYLKGLYAAGWRYVASEGGRSGDANYLKSLGLNYINYNCDQCGLWRAGLHTEAGTAMNFWECYYPAEVPYILQGAASGKPNGVLAGAWANSGGDNDILTNSINGSMPSYKSILDTLVAGGHPVTDFAVWGGEASNRATMDALGFTRIVQSLQVNGYPANLTPTPPPPLPTIRFLTAPQQAPDGSLFVIGGDKATWRSTDGGKTWGSLGGVCIYDLAVDSTHVFVIGTSTNLYYKPITAYGPAGWLNLGGLCFSAPKLTGTGNVEVVGSDGRIWKRTMTTGWIKAIDKVQ
jgi:hypothetical protein